MYWQTLSWPFRPTPLIAVTAFLLVAVAFTAFASLNFWVAVLVVTMGSVVWYAVLGGLSLYARTMLTQAAQGLFDEPLIGETDINPFDSGRGLQLGFAHLLVFAILYYNGPALGPALILPILLLPLLWTGIVLDDAPFRYFQPAQATQLIRGLGIYFPMSVLLISGSLGWLHHALQYANGVLNLLASAFAFLFANLLYGILLYHRRSELHLITLKSPEQTFAAEIAAEQQRLDRLFHEVHTHVNAGSHADAVRLIEARVAEDPVSQDPLMHERLKTYQDERLLLEHAVRYLARLMARDENRKAWALMKECLEREPRFRPPEGEMLLQLTRFAGPEDAGIVNELLADFAEAYPDSPLIPDAGFRRARVCIELLRDTATGTELLADIARDYPDFARSEPFQRYRRRLKPV
jgi:hypothetical protein